jgi:hypothetical protein
MAAKRHPDRGDGGDYKHGKNHSTLSNPIQNSARALLRNLISVGREIQKDSLGDVSALVWCDPFMVQVWAAVAFWVFDKGCVNCIGDKNFYRLV